MDKKKKKKEKSLLNVSFMKAIIRSRYLRLWYEFLLEIRREIISFTQLLFLVKSPQWGTADAEVKVPSTENPEKTTVLPSKLRAGENIAKLSYLFCFLPFRSIRLYFSPILSLIFNVSSVGRRNKSRSLCSSLQPIDSGSHILFCNSESDVFVIVILVTLPPVSLPALSIKSKILWIIE